MELSEKNNNSDKIYIPEELSHRLELLDEVVAQVISEGGGWWFKFKRSLIMKYFPSNKLLLTQTSMTGLFSLNKSPQTRQVSSLCWQVKRK